MSVVRKFSNLEVPNEEGKYHRLVCMTGPEKGSVYILEGQRIVMGRGDTADIIINDDMSSREHTELVLVESKYVLSDLGSQNGVLINDLKVNQHTLDQGDRVIIGRTVYRYDTIQVKKKELAIVEEEPPEVPAVKKKKRKKKKKKSEGFSLSSSTGGGGNRQKIIRVVIGLAAVMLLLPEDKPSENEAKKEDSAKVETKDGTKKDEENKSEIDLKYENYIKKGQGDIDPELEDKLVAVLHRGKREFRERNYYRAMKEFSLALILAPNHGYASFYLAKSKQELFKEIDQFKLKATSDFQSLRYDSAIVSYCAILKLLEENPESDDYKEAQGNIKKIEKLMGMREGETKCLQK